MAVISDPHRVLQRFMSFKDASEDVELKKRLQLFQLFSRLYEQNGDFLKDVLEHYRTGELHSQGLSHYLQGIVINHEALLVTNLVKGQSQLVQQARPVWVIGRDSSQVSVAIRDKRLSRRHAVIQYQPDVGFCITDLGSSNGTFINGDRIQGPVPLKDGDRIRLGSLTLKFFVCQDSKALPLSASNPSNGEEVVMLPTETDENFGLSQDLDDLLEEDDFTPTGFDATLHSIQNCLQNDLE